MLVNTAVRRHANLVKPSAAIADADLEFIHATLDTLDTPAYLLDRHGRILARNQATETSSPAWITGKHVLSAIVGVCAEATPAHIAVDSTGYEVISLLPLSDLLPPKSATLPHPEAYCIGVLHRIVQTHRS